MPGAEYLCKLERLQSLEAKCSSFETLRHRHDPEKYSSNGSSEKDFTNYVGQSPREEGGTRHITIEGLEKNVSFSSTSLIALMCQQNTEYIR